jgi:hypothetical protein
MKEDVDEGEGGDEQVAEALLGAAVVREGLPGHRRQAYE